VCDWLLQVHSADSLGVYVASNACVYSFAVRSKPTCPPVESPLQTDSTPHVPYVLSLRGQQLGHQSRGKRAC